MKPLILFVLDPVLHMYPDFISEMMPSCEIRDLNTRTAVEMASKRGSEISLVITNMYLGHGIELNAQRSREGLLTGLALKEKLESMCPHAKFMIFYDPDTYNEPVIPELRSCPNVIIPGSLFEFQPTKVLEEVKKALGQTGK